MRIGKWARTIGVAASMALMMGGAALAATTSQNMAVSAGVSAACNFGTAPALNFTYDPLVTNASSGSDDQSTATIALQCTNGDSITIGLSLGANAVSTQRYVKSGSDTMSYNLYSTSDYVTAWNETTTVSDTGTGSSKNYTGYGSIPKGQNAKAGSYTDTVSVDVTY